MNDDKLIEVGLADERWSDDAKWAVYGCWDLTEASEEESEKLKLGVINGVISLDDLRAGVRWANALDKEATDMYGADLCKGDQRAERVARRLMHLAGRTALDNVKNRRKRLIARVACKQIENLVQ